MIDSNFTIPNRSSKGSSVAGRGCGVLFGLFFSVLGCLFIVFVAKEFFASVKERRWEKVPATLSRAAVEVVDQRKNEPFKLAVDFSYEFDGRHHRSYRYARNASTDSSYEAQALKAKSLRERSELVAYVDPDDPGMAVLHRASLWFGLVILLPLLFVAIGGSIIYASLRGGKKARSGANKTEAISSSPTRSNKKLGTWVGIVFGVIFLCVGIGLIYPMAVRPLTMAKAAKAWPALPCEIIWAQVKSHTGDDSTTYSVDIFYRYEYEGQQHRSNRHRLTSGSSSGRGSKQRIVDRFRAEKSPLCYVDPSLPERAVLDRKLGGSVFLGLIPLVAGGVGACLLLFSLKSLRKEVAVSPGSPIHAIGGVRDTISTRTLAPGKSRFGAVIGTFLAGLFWNGMVFGFLFPEAWLQDGDFMLKLFSIPFMLVGIGIGIGFIYAVLNLFSPKAELTLSPGAPSLGERISFEWRLKGSARRIRRLRIVLRGVEKATYRRGTNTTTAEETFFADVLADLSDSNEMYSGSIFFSVPSDLMHSFDAGNNEIAWRIEVLGDVPFWPDIGDKFDITVQPAHSY